MGNTSVVDSPSRSLEVSDPVVEPSSPGHRLVVAAFHSFHDDTEKVPSYVADARPLSCMEAVGNFVIASVGAGVAIFPSSMGKVGFLAAPLLMGVCAAACSESGILVSKGCEKAEQHAGGKLKVLSYEQFAGIAGGSLMLRAIMVTKNFTMLGCIVAYMLFVTDSIHQLLDDAVGKLTIRFLIVMPAFAMLAMVKDMKAFAQFQTVGLLAVILECGSMVVGSLFIYFSNSCTDSSTGDLHGCPVYDAWRFDLGEFGRTCAVFIFSFAIIKTVPTVRGEMAKPQLLPSVLRCSFLLIYSINMVVMCTGYLAFGDKVSDNLIEDLYSDDRVVYLGKAASLGILVNLIISTPLFFVCVFSAFEASGTTRFHKPLSLPNVFLRFGIVVVLALVASLDSIVALCQGRSLESKLSAKDFISLISSVFNTCNTTFWPISLFYLLRRLMNENLPQSPPWRWAIHFLQLLLGLNVLVFGFKESIAEIAEKLT